MNEYVTTFSIWFTAPDERAAKLVAEEYQFTLMRHDEVQSVNIEEVEPLD